MVWEKGYAVSNIDVTIIAQRPKLAAFIPKMAENLAAVLELSVDRVNVKATTTEKLGFTECCRKPKLRTVRGQQYDGLTFRKKL